MTCTLGQTCSIGAIFIAFTSLPSSAPAWFSPGEDRR